LPNAQIISVILKDSLETVSHNLTDRDLDEVAERLVGKSGRAIRKIVIDVLITRVSDFDQPITKADLLTVAQKS
jgi:hypothetical protein